VQRGGAVLRGCGRAEAPRDFLGIQRGEGRHLELPSGNLRVCELEFNGI